MTLKNPSVIDKKLFRYIFLPTHELSLSRIRVICGKKHQISFSQNALGNCSVNFTRGKKRKRIKRKNYFSRPRAIFPGGRIKITFMKLTVLGSGTSVPHPLRSSSAYWLETGKGSLLLDCAASAVHRMAEEKLDWAGLDAVWISHFHLDHAGGLAPFLFGTKYAPETRKREKPLKIFGPEGLKKLLENFDAANDYGLFEQPFPVEIIEVEPLEKFEILPGAEAVACKTPHTKESCALFIRDESGKRLVYTADTGVEKTLGALARNVDLLVIECSFVRDKPVEKHLELADAMYLVRMAEPKRVVLTHLYPEWDDVDFKSEVEKFSPGCEVIEATDGLRLSI
jgi:ribonuclease BN (tRNA processing enzyme)